LTRAAKERVSHKAEKGDGGALAPRGGETKKMYTAAKGTPEKTKVPKARMVVE